MGGIGDIFSGLGDSVGNIGSLVADGFDGLIAGTAGAVRDAGPAGIFLLVAFFVILAWVLRK